MDLAAQWSPGHYDFQFPHSSDQRHEHCTKQKQEKYGQEKLIIEQIWVFLGETNKTKQNKQLWWDEKKVSNGQ